MYKSLKHFKTLLFVYSPFFLSACSAKDNNMYNVVDEHNNEIVEQVDVKINISKQTMKVETNTGQSYQWEVSTAREGKITPTGNYNISFLSENHFSSLYNNTPMPYSIFFSGNYAIHGTTSVDNLGNPASAGCVRLHPDNAETLFKLAELVKFYNFDIKIVE